MRFLIVEFFHVFVNSLMPKVDVTCRRRFEKYKTIYSRKKMSLDSQALFLKIDVGGRHFIFIFIF